jgi:hypothetical protein
MKKAYVSILATLLLVGLVFGRDKADFDKFLKSNVDKVDNSVLEKSYEKIEFTNKKTGEKKKFTDFLKIDRYIYMLLQTDLLSREIEDLYNKWKEELKSAEETPDVENEASKKDIIEYMNKLMELRKKNAEQVEVLVEKIFKKWPDKFTKEEQDYILKTIREYHDKNSLVKRKK